MNIRFRLKHYSYLLERIRENSCQIKIREHSNSFVHIRVKLNSIRENSNSFVKIRV